MRYLIVLKADQAPTAPPAALMDGIVKLGEEATKAGALLVPPTINFSYCSALSS